MSHITGAVLAWYTSNVSQLTFETLDCKFRFTAWPAFTSISEWGDLVADLGEGVIEQFLLGGAEDAVKLLTDKTNVTMVTVQAFVAYLDGADLGERCAHYLEIAKVEVHAAGADSSWVPLYGDKSAENAEQAQVDGVQLLAAAWHTVREGLRPLSSRLSSFAAAQA